MKSFARYLDLSNTLYSLLIRRPVSFNHPDPFNMASTILESFWAILKFFHLFANCPIEKSSTSKIGYRCMTNRKYILINFVVFVLGNSILQGLAFFIFRYFFDSNVGKIFMLVSCHSNHTFGTC